jgi:hypothetical protein
VGILAAGTTWRYVRAEQGPPAALQTLEVLAGTWNADGQTFDTEYSKAGKDSSTLHNDCWQSGMFYACDQVVDGDSKALIVFAAGEKPGAFVSYGIVPPNPANAGRLVIDGNTWAYGGVITGAPAPYWRTLNEFSNPGGTTTIHYKVQYSKDGTNWISTKEGVETKQK